MACSNEEMTVINFDNEIKPKASITEVMTSTKAVPNYNGPINNNFTTSFPVGIYAYNVSLGWKAGTSNSLTPNAPNLINNDNAAVLGTTGHSIVFNTGPYYFPSGGENVNFYAYAPYGTESTPATNGGAPSVTISLDGYKDVMWASGSGYKKGSGVAVQPQFNFVHKLTQLRFTFKAGTGYPASGNNVTSLLVKAQPTTLVMNVGTGAISTSGSANLQALSSADQVSGIAITTAGTNANSPIITTTSSGAAAYLLDITVKVGSAGTVIYTNVPVNVTSLAGNIHMITITFTQKAVSLTVNAGAWNIGQGGSVGGV